MSDGLSSIWHYLAVNHVRVLELTQQHLAITAIALGLGTVLGVALGVLGYRQPRLRGLILGTAGLIMTIPSLALYALLVGLLGLGTVPVVVALSLYSLLPIVRNTVTGLTGVDARTDAYSAHKDAYDKLFGQLDKLLTTEQMTKLNAAVDIDGQDIPTVVQDFLKKSNVI